MIAIIMALAAGAAGSSDGTSRLGYPVFLEGAENGRCQVVVEDMILSASAELTAWMSRWDDKSRRIDIVVTGNSPPRCVQATRKTLHQIGYPNVIVRHGSAADYEPMKARR